MIQRPEIKEVDKKDIVSNLDELDNKLKTYFKKQIKKRRDWDLNPGEGYLTGFQVLRLTRLDYLGIYSKGIFRKGI